MRYSFVLVFSVPLLVCTGLRANQAPQNCPGELENAPAISELEVKTEQLSRVIPVLGKDEVDKRLAMLEWVKQTPAFCIELANYLNDLALKCEAWEKGGRLGEGPHKSFQEPEVIAEVSRRAGLVVPSEVAEVLAEYLPRGHWRDIYGALPTDSRQRIDDYIDKVNPEHGLADRLSNALSGNSLLTTNRNKMLRAALPPRSQRPNHERRRANRAVLRSFTKLSLIYQKFAAEVAIRIPKEGLTYDEIGPFIRDYLTGPDPEGEFFRRQVKKALFSSSVYQEFSFGAIAAAFAIEPPLIHDQHSIVAMVRESLETELIGLAKQLEREEARLRRLRGKQADARGPSAESQGNYQLLNGATEFLRKAGTKDARKENYQKKTARPVRLIPSKTEEPLVRPSAQENGVSTKFSPVSEEHLRAMIEPRLVPPLTADFFMDWLRRLGANDKKFILTHLPAIISHQRDLASLVRNRAVSRFDSGIYELRVKFAGSQARVYFGVITENEGTIHQKGEVYIIGAANLPHRSNSHLTWEKMEEHWLPFLEAARQAKAAR